MHKTQPDQAFYDVLLRENVRKAKRLPLGQEGCCPSIDLDDVP